MRREDKSDYVMIKTAIAPTSIMIKKETYAELYPFRNPRRIHVVFPSKSRMLSVDSVIANYLLDTYSYISLCDVESNEEPTEMGEGEPSEKRATAQRTAVKGRRPKRDV